MPVILVISSMEQAERIGKDNRYGVGLEWQSNLSETSGEPTKNIAIYWMPYFDALNPLEGPELFVFFSDDELQKIKQLDDPLAHATQVEEGLKETSCQSQFLPKGMEVGVWALPFRNDKWGRSVVGLPPLQDE